MTPAATCRPHILTRQHPWQKYMLCHASYASALDCTMPAALPASSCTATSIHITPHTIAYAITATQPQALASCAWQTCWRASAAAQQQQRAPAAQQQALGERASCWRSSIREASRCQRRCRGLLRSGLSARPGMMTPSRRSQSGNPSLRCGEWNTCCSCTCSALSVAGNAPLCLRVQHGVMLPAIAVLCTVSHHHLSSCVCSGTWPISPAAAFWQAVLESRSLTHSQRPRLLRSHLLQLPHAAVTRCPAGQP